LSFPIDPQNMVLSAMVRNEIKQRNKHSIFFLLIFFNPFF
jgi:hypothetical protein